MALSIGDKLGPYEILGLIGKGGMGEVYRAHDSRLRRDVAIKVSNEEFSERFAREARAIASLNHTNICHLYDVGPNYLVMEYVEGETLAGPMEWADALPYIRQLIDGIEAAHEKNIIHRDLKPANIKVTPEGVLKILDFGLAKTTEAPASGNPGESPTLTMGATAVGAILGTAAYMAPEQAKGKTADKRSDIWSFGVVVYELLTGSRLFQGESVVEVLGGVLNKTPDISATPARVHRLLQWCLEKDRKERLASISDARKLLDEVPSEVAHAAHPATSKTRWIPWAVAAVLLLTLLPGNLFHYSETPPEAQVINAAVLPPDEGIFNFALPYGLPALSPDGTRIVYSAKIKDGRPQLWVRRLDTATAQPLPGTEEAATPFWSPDSRWVGFGQDTKLKKIDIQGGPPVVITDLPSALRGGTWNVDGVILYHPNNAQAILRVSASGGQPQPVTDRSGREPWFLPDGRHFLYTQGRTGDMPVLVGSIDEPKKPGKVVAQAHSQVIYALGHLLYLRENTLMAQPFDVVRLETTGEARPIAENIPTFTSPSRLAGFTASQTGLLSYLSGANGGQSQLLWKDRKGLTTGKLGESTAVVGNVELSPDQKSVAVGISSPQAPQDLWIYDVARGIRTRLTFDPAIEREPVWSPDGTTLYFAWQNAKGGYDLMRKPSNGTGSEEVMISSDVVHTPSSISPDGRFLIYGRAASGNTDVWLFPLTTEPGKKPEPRPFIESPSNENRPRFSPDGKWVAYQSNESGTVQVYVVPFPGPGGKRQISTDGGDRPRWRKDGKEIFYNTPDGALMAAQVSVQNGALNVGKVEKLFDGIVTYFGTLYDVSADGQKFLVVDDGASSSVTLHLVQNWTAALRK